MATLPGPVAINAAGDAAAAIVTAGRRVSRIVLPARLTAQMRAPGRYRLTVDTGARPIAGARRSVALPAPP